MNKHMSHVSVCGFVSFMSSFICRFQLFPCAVISLVLSQSPEVPWTRDRMQVSTPFHLPLSASCSCSCSGSRSRCVYLLCRPPSFLFPYHCSMAALSGRQQFHCSCATFIHLLVLLWVLAPFCPAHPVDWTASKSLWYLAPACHQQVTLYSVLSLPPGQSLLHSLLQTPAILLLLVLPACSSLLHAN